MQLLPIIIVVSLLGLLLVISCTLFVFHYMKVRAHRKTPQMAQDNQRPTRQLTVRGGKVIPVSEAVQTPSARDVRSVDLSTLRSANSIKSKLSQDRNFQSPRATVKSFDRRRSSALADLEAQNGAAETWEANVQRLHLSDERLRDPYTAKNRRREADRRVSISSQTIAASLKKAYRGTPAFETQALQIPPTLLASEPAEIHTKVRKKKRDLNLGRPPSINTYKNGFEATRLTPSPREQRPVSQTFNRNTSESLQASGFAVPTKGIEPPKSAFLNRHSLPAEQPRPLDWTRNSFFSASISSASSTQLQQPDPSSLADRQDRQSGPRPADRHSQLRPKSSMRNPSMKPHRIDTKVSNIRDTSFINSATSSTTTAPNLQRDSRLSSSSIATFASSDLSSTWTFGNAQPIAILPGIMSRTPAPSPASTSRRPKSKYGRYPKKRREKELPVVPRSPLAR